MVADYRRRAGADERGLWHEYTSGGLSGYPWNEITRLLGKRRPVNLAGKLLVFLVADHESGHFIEFIEDEDGFDHVVSALPHFLSGMEEKWMERVVALDKDDDAIVLWQRSDYPKST